MSWIVVREFLPVDGGAPPPPGQLSDMGSRTEGSLLFELRSREHRDDVRQLLRFTGTNGACVTFAVSGGAVGLEHSDGGPVLRTDAEGFADDPLLVCYAWSAGLGSLQVSNLHTGATSVARTDQPLDLPRGMQDVLRSGRLDGAELVHDDQMVFAALADHVFELGLRPSLTSTCTIETPEGSLQIKDLQAGMSVLTQDKGPVRVHSVLRFEVPAYGSLRPVRLRAPYFDLTEDVLVGQSQLIMIAGELIEYLFGVEEVLAEAQHLLEGSTVLAETRLTTAIYFQVLLETHEMLTVSGAGMASTFNPDQHPIAGRGDMPKHDVQVRPVLRPYEAMTLRSMRRT